MKSPRILRYIDWTFCVIILPAMIAIFPVERWAQNFPLYSVAVGVWLYTLYFLNRRFVVPGLIRDSGRNPASWMLMLLSIGVTLLLASVNLFDTDYRKFDNGLFTFLPRLKMYQQAVLCWFMFVESFSFTVGLIDYSYRQRMKRQEIEAARDKEIITQLRNRIKPHFMFNTLNTLYGLFLTENPAALPSLAKYISMLQYIHRASDITLVPIADEIEYIREYIDLQSLRLNGKTKVMFSSDVEYDNRLFPPLLLVTFVENCFKYGVSSVEETLIEITVTGKDNVLIFTTHNKVCSKGNGSSHAGIDNCRKRLGFAFPGLYTLEINDDGKCHSVRLTLKYNGND